MLDEINDKITLLVKDLDAPEDAVSGICVAQVIHNLAKTDDWSGTQLADLDQLARRIDITQKLFCRYDSNWRKVDDQRLQEPWLGLAALLLYKSCLLSRETGGEDCLLAKRMNVLLKALELTQADYLADDSILHQNILKDFSLLVEKSIIGGSRSVTVAEFSEHSGNVLKKIPLTVLFFEGPIARAYLETIRSLGLAPEKIINMVASVDVSHGKPVGRILPGRLRKSYAATIQRNKIHYWPRQIRKKHADLVNSINFQVQRSFKFSQEVQRQAIDLLPLSEYSDNIDNRLFTGINDPALQEYLAAEPASAILFTGGGIVPEALLTLDNIRLIHIHPGFLPNIRGADCVLWSTMLTGHPSATCFYMSPGIDAGNIVKPCWLPPVTFEFDASGIDTKSLYRTVYGFFDPWVRSYVLREVLREHRRFDDMPSVVQREDEGLTYHFMHTRFQALAIQGLLG